MPHLLGWQSSSDPEIMCRFDLHKAWVWLTNSGLLRGDATFAEFSAAFDEVQKKFVGARDFSCWHKRASGRATLRWVLGDALHAVMLSQWDDRRIEREIINAIESRKLVVRPTIRELESKIAFMRARSAVAAAYSRARQTETVTPSQMRKLARRYDEQVQAEGPGAVAGHPYFIEQRNGQTHFGRLDDSGHLPRIYTDSAEDFTVYWGDVALAMWPGEVYAES